MSQWEDKYAKHKKEHRWKQEELPFYGEHPHTTNQYPSMGSKSWGIDNAIKIEDPPVFTIEQLDKLFWSDLVQLGWRLDGDTDLVLACPTCDRVMMKNTKDKVPKSVIGLTEVILEGHYRATPECKQ